MREEMLLAGPLEPTNQWYTVAEIAGISRRHTVRIYLRCWLPLRRRDDEIGWDGPARWRCAWARPANPLLDIDQTAMDQRLRRNVEDPSVVAAAHGLLRNCETLARPCEGGNEPGDSLPIRKVCVPQSRRACR